MNSRLLFWFPVLLRLLLTFLVALMVGFIWNLAAGLVFGLLCVTVFMTVQLYYLNRLSDWLDHPHSERLPDGWGAWQQVFSRLYRMRRGDEKSQSELSEWLARFKQAMNFLPDGVVIMSDLALLEWCNPEAEKHLGLQLVRDQGMRVMNLVRHPDFVKYIIGGRYDQPLKLTHRDRKLIIQIIPFEQERQILVSHDVTESERIDMMRRDFVANASHELRTPLTVINGFLEIASAQPDLSTETRMAHTQLMIEQGKRMQNLVEDMLTLTRLESPDYPLSNEIVDINTLLHQILREAQALAMSQQTITLTVNGPDISGSVEELRSALGNLVLNAVRYTPSGGKIDVVWEEVEEGVRFTVRDTGIGIAQEHLSRLTERFYRVDSMRSRETRGTGLGLAIVRHVLLRHGATLQIESQLGQGSVFSVLFLLRK